jgi:glycosyltransferase involved in cell wall biosynthesis
MEKIKIDMVEFNPRVSIIIPVYNGENYLSEAIASALGQTYDNYEIIVVNDGSTDGTERIALSYGNKIKYHIKQNGGQSSALNYGIKKMEGEYFSWLSHDDIYYPEKIEKQIKLLSEKEVKIGFVYSNCSVIDANGKQIKADTIFGQGKINPTFYLLSFSAYNGISVLIPKVSLEEVGMFNEMHPLTSDVELFFDLSLKYPFYYTDEVLVASRSHKGQMTYRRYNEHQKGINFFLMDSIDKLTNEDLVKISGRENYESVIIYLAKIWSKAGHKKAYLMLLKRLKQNSLLEVVNYLKVKLDCLLLYNWKSIKRSIKRLFLNY